MKTLGQILGTSTKGPYDDDIDGLAVGQSRDFTHDGHHMRVTAVRATGFHSGRRRYLVECLTCAVVVHEATTGAVYNMERHAQERGSQS